MKNLRLKDYNFLLTAGALISLPVNLAFAQAVPTAPVVSKAFSPSPISLGADSLLTITVANPPGSVGSNAGILIIIFRVCQLV